VVVVVLVEQAAEVVAVVWLLGAVLVLAAVE